MKQSEHIPSIDAMRGVAALAVVLHHFMVTNGSVPPGPLKSLAAYGWYSVHVFFVISGLVIPYALHRARYRVSDYFAFMCKRLARLEPPYLFSILVVFLAWWLGGVINTGFSRVSPFADPKGLLLHLGYLNAVFGRRWINPVYWTLAIEFQYYVGVGLLYPLLAHARRWARLVTMCLLVSLVFLLPGGRFIFKHLPFFFVGVALFQHRVGLTGARECALTTAALLAFAAFKIDLPTAAAGLLAALCIQLTSLRQRPLVFLGEISYSLYLLHLLVGDAVLRVCELLGMSWPFGVAVATVVAVFAGWLMYLAVERPSRQLSSRIKYRREAKPAALHATATDAASA